jgi:hypothetical protein
MNSSHYNTPPDAPMQPVLPPAPMGVILPVYNEARWVDTIVKRILAQREVTQLAAADDGSNDDSWDRAARYPVSTIARNSRETNFLSVFLALAGADRVWYPFDRCIGGWERVLPIPFSSSGRLAISNASDGA